ncbi:MAG: HAD family hydrolase [Clostridia bacterium]|nr:HAD family hydrolase [Clostridia bacterium]
MIKAVLFDLDGTLLPLDQDVFLKEYFRLLKQSFKDLGYDPDELEKATWIGTGAMMKNDGSHTNEELFWKYFNGYFGRQMYCDKERFDLFYRDGFNGLKKVCGFNPAMKELVDYIKGKGLRTAVATSPVFPYTAQESRIRWAGLETGDFEFYTSYENVRSCKPAPAYYLEVAGKLGVPPEECLMVGNDADEDTAAAVTGMKVFLLTDCLLNRKNRDISGIPHGSLDELYKYINALCQ